MIKQKKEPAIRFKDGGLWKATKLKKVTKRVTRKNHNLETDRPLTISADLGLIDQRDYFNRAVASKNMQNYFLVYNGEFAYNKSYSIGFPYGAIKRLDQYDKGALSTLYIVFKPEKQINTNFLKSYYDSFYWHKQVSYYTAEGARNHGLLNISTSDFFEAKIIFPESIVEQEKIGSFFNMLNKLIKLETDKLNLFIEILNNEKNKLFKLSTKDDLFQTTKLKNVFTERNLKSVQTEDYPLVSFTVEDGVTPKTARYEREQLVKGDKSEKLYKITKLNDIVYNPANLKFGAISRNKYGNAVFSPIYITFEVNPEFNLIYMENLVTSTNFINYSLKYQQGTVFERQSVNTNDFLNIKLNIPSLETQNKYAEYLEDLNNIIKYQQKKLNELDAIKSYFNKHMFI